MNKEQIIEGVPEKEENKPKIEVGKWYSFNWDWRSSNSTIIAKIKGVNEDSIRISWRSYLWGEKDYSTSDTYILEDISNIKELSIDEVQKYLPEGHPNKIKTVQSFEVGKWYKKDGYYLKPKEIIDTNSQWNTEYISPEGEYHANNSGTDDLSTWELLTDLTEIQQYLPDEHPDKSSNFNTSKYKMGDEEIAKAQFVTLDEAFVLPEKWCIKSNKDIDPILCKWRGETDILSPEENVLTYQRCWVHVKYIKDFTEITFEQFKKYVLKEPEKMENASKDNLITRAVKTNNPQLIADELGYTIEEIIESENSTIHSCVINNLNLLRGVISCSGLDCTDDKCPFHNGNEEAISWLRSESKSVSEGDIQLQDSCFNPSNNSGTITMNYTKSDSKRLLLEIDDEELPMVPIIYSKTVGIMKVD